MLPIPNLNLNSASTARGADQSGFAWTGGGAFGAFNVNATTGGASLGGASGAPSPVVLAVVGLVVLMLLKKRKR